MLEQAALSAVDVKAGDGLSLRLQWHALQKIPQPFQLLVTVRLIDAQGRTVGERVSKPCDGFCAIDDWPVGQSVEDRHGLVVPADTSPGDYTLHLEVWAPRLGQYLPVQAETVASGTSLELARIHVQRPNVQ
jgi:hypothetical protein